MTRRFPAAGRLSKAKSRSGVSAGEAEGGRSKVSLSDPLSACSETGAGIGGNDCGENVSSKRLNLEGFTCGGMQNLKPVPLAGVLHQLQQRLCGIARIFTDSKLCQALICEFSAFAQASTQRRKYVVCQTWRGARQPISGPCGSVTVSFTQKHSRRTQKSRCLSHRSTGFVLT